MTTRKTPVKEAPAKKAAASPDSPKRSALSKKAAYTKKAEARLEEAKAKLNVVKAKLKHAVASGQIGALDTLDIAQKQADTHVATVEKKIRRLKEASEDSWEDSKDSLEKTWDDLMFAIKKIVRRIT